MKIRYSTFYILLFLIIGFVGIAYMGIQRYETYLVDKLYKQEVLKVKSDVKHYLKAKRDGNRLFAFSLSLNEELRVGVLKHKDIDRVLDAILSKMVTYTSLRDIWIEVLDTNNHKVYTSWTLNAWDKEKNHLFDMTHFLHKPHIETTIEQWKYDLASVVTVPIYSNSRCIGVIRTYLLFDNIFRSMEEGGYENLILLCGTHKIPTIGPYRPKKIANHYILSNTQNVFKVDEQSIYRLMDTPYIIDKNKKLFYTKYSIFNKFNVQMGHVVITYPLEKIDFSHVHESIRMLLMILVMLFLATLAVGYYVYIVKYKKFMQKQNKVLEAKVNEKTKHLKYLASHDSLTQLPNREFMIKLLQRQINIAKNNPYSIYVLFLDLDRFKEVNDTYGHAVGDQLLQKIAKRFTKIIDKKSVVGRVGGDEFVAIVRGKTEVELQVLLKRLLHITSKKVTIDNLELFVTASVGISHYPSDNTDAHELFIESDIAMYHAKLKGKNTYIFYDSSMVQDIKLRQSLGVDIRKALKRNEFEIFYQPKIDVVSGNVIGLEGLIRWFHPIKGIVNPIEFLPLSEEIGLIVEIDEYVREKALKQVKNWKNKGLETGVLSLNLSTKELETPLFVRKLKELIQTIGFESKYLELEILEHKLIENKEYAAKILTEMEQEGFNVAMDDFGTGYSSLAYLQKLPLTTLKIDRTFVSDIEVNESNLAIVKMILNLAKTLHINVIAEGVENRKQLDILLSEGCQYMQGYYLSKPLSAKVCEDFLFAEKSKIDTCQIAGIVT